MAIRFCRYTHMHARSSQHLSNLFSCIPGTLNLHILVSWNAKIYRLSFRLHTVISYLFMIRVPPAVQNGNLIFNINIRFCKS